MSRSSADAIVVLGARVLPDGRLGGAVRRRVERAAQAYDVGTAPVVLCAGGQRWNGHVEALAMRRSLTELGVDERHILTEVFSLSTAENAQYCARLFALFGWTHAAVVTCPWHLPRAIRDFELCGLRVTPLAARDLPASPLHVAKRSVVERVSSVLDRVRLEPRFPW